MARLPNFLVIGAPKSGTTSLYYYLRQHPEVFLPVQKELHYFSYEKLKANANGPGDARVLATLCATGEEYAQHYTGAKGERAIGDISPSYLYYGVQGRIKQELGEVKIIVMLRNPVEKAYSQYMHMVRDQHETLPFYDALMAEETRRSDGWSDIWRYAESSLYADRLRAFMDCFGRENVHVILFDEFTAQPEVVMRRLLGFLGVDESFRINSDEVYNRTGEARSRTVANFLNRPNTVKTLIKCITPDAWRIALRLRIMDVNTAEKPAMDDRAAIYLRNYFADDVAKLETLLNRRLYWDQQPLGRGKIDETIARHR